MKKPVLAAIVACALAACGGGGGSAGPEPLPPPPPPPPTAAFALATTAPADGATGVDRGAAFTATFTTPVAASSVNFLTVRMTGPEGNAIGNTASTSGTELKLQPATALPGNTRYTVNLASAIADTSGRTLPTSYARSFTTAPQSWDASAKAVATLPNFTADTAPLIASDKAGNVTVAWHAGDMNSDALYATRFDAAAGAWSAPALVQAASSVSIVPLSLVAAPNGNLYLLWFERGSATRARIALYDVAAGAWQASADAPGVPAGGTAEWLKLIADPAGNLTVLARAMTPAGVAEYATRYDAASAAWGTPQAIGAFAAAANEPFGESLAVDGYGNVTAAWIATDGARALVAAHYDAAAGHWGAPQTLDSSVLTQGQPFYSMSADALGLVTLAWAHDFGMAATPQARAARYDPLANAWSAPVRLDNAADSTGAYGPQVVTDAAGFATAVWRQQQGLWSSRYSPANASWSTPAQVAGSTSMAHGFALGADIAGNVTLVSSDDQHQMADQFLASTGQWQPRTDIGKPASGDGVFANPPVLDVAPSGSATAAWFAQDTVNGAPRYVVGVNRFK